MRLLLCLMMCSACPGWAEADDPYGDPRGPAGGDGGSNTCSGTLQVEFDTGQPPGGAGGVRGRGVYLWIEDAAGNYIDTVQQYFGRILIPCPPWDLTYTCTGYRYYDDPCWDWHDASGETALLQPDPLVPPDPVTGTLVVDGVTMASALPQPGNLPASSGTVTSASWDCRDRNGALVGAGTYTVQMEITWERADGLGHTRPCETYPGEFPCNFRYSAQIELGNTNASATLAPADWMMSSGTVTFTAQ